jgi:hypothetical protein
MLGKLFHFSPQKPAEQYKRRFSLINDLSYSHQRLSAALNLRQSAGKTF